MSRTFAACWYKKQSCSACEIICTPSKFLYFRTLNFTFLLYFWSKSQIDSNPETNPNSNPTLILIQFNCNLAPTQMLTRTLDLKIWNYIQGVPKKRNLHKLIMHSIKFSFTIMYVIIIHISLTNFIFLCLRDFIFLSTV